MPAVRYAILGLLLILLLATSRHLYLEAVVPKTLRRTSKPPRRKAGSKQWLADLREHGRTSLRWLGVPNKTISITKPEFSILRDPSDKLLYTLTDPPSLPPRIPIKRFKLSPSLVSIIANFTDGQRRTYDDIRDTLSKPAPLDRSCGPWQESYALFHAEERQRIQDNQTTGVPPLIYARRALRPY